MEKIWLKNYPAGVPETIDPDHFSSLVDILEQSIEKYGEKTAFVNMDSEMSFKELGLKSREFAAYLPLTHITSRIYAICNTDIDGKRSGPRIGNLPDLKAQFR